MTNPKNIDEYSVAYCVGYKPPPNAFYSETKEICLDNMVFRRFETAAQYLNVKRQEYEKNQIIATLVYKEIQEFEQNERNAIESGSREPDYPTRVEKFRYDRWAYHLEQLGGKDVELTNKSDIFIIRELKFIS